jgi:EmrB/QacA subfamily drug resistance transporter
MHAPSQPGATKPLSRRDTRLVIFGVLLPVFMGSLDNTILASALPTIGRGFGDAAGLPWLITIYLLAATAGMPLYGKLADIHGRAFALRIAIFAHMAGSLICAMAPSIFVLILGRAVQGAGGAGLSSISVVILGDAAAPKERGQYYAYFAICYTTAGACGPALGGFLAEHLHWSAIFWLNIPLGLGALAVTTWLLRRLPRHERTHRLDILGALALVTASVSFMLALNLGGKSYPWSAPQIITLVAIAVGLGVGFVLRLATAPEPLIPITVLINPIVCCAIAANAFGWGSIIGLNIFLPMYLQSVIGLSPTEAGLTLIVLMVSLNTSAGLAGQLLGRVRRYKLLPISMLVIAVGSAAILALWAERTTMWSFQALLFLIGAGFGPTPSLNAVVLQNAVPPHQLGIAVGTMNFSRNLFTTMLIALLGAMVLGNTTTIEAAGPGQFGGVLSPAAEAAAAAFTRVFFTVTACLAITFTALVFLEERPLREDAG